MERINVFLARHLWAQTLLSVLVAAALLMLVFPGRSFAEVAARTAAISLGGIGVAATARRREKRATGGTTDGVVSLDQKLRKGEVPAEPRERRAMSALVEQRLHRSRHRVTALLFLAALFVSITVLTAFTSGRRQTIGMAVFTVVFGGWMLWMSNLQNRRLRTMRAALRDESPSGAASGSPAETSDGGSPA
ncbi:hypothetical protein ABZ858_29710 [Streptomyces sp. NPDC047017]|uniref:hypothetical protein n=1 Tax=Streptomyces sp. NPDC047017 TaxID=3155024 RepID=UPI0033FEEB9C